MSPRDATAALLTMPDGRYLMQLRDQKPGIFFPGFWGLFGGAIEPGEGVEDSLRRELKEEIGIDIDDIAYFTKYTFDFAYQGHATVVRYFYGATLSNEQYEAIRLGEGSDVRPFAADDLLKMPGVVPYDAFAIWMHATRSR